MKSKEEIIEILKREFGYIYCYNCKYEQEDSESDSCEWCHRKYMNWSISDSAAEEIAEEICN